jgi:hypothetical protein
MSLAEQMKALTDAGMTKKEAAEVLLKQKEGPMDSNAMIKLIVSALLAMGIIGLVVMFFGGDYIIQLVLFIGLPLLCIMVAMRILNWGVLPMVLNGDIASQAKKLFNEVVDESVTEKKEEAAG